MVSRPAGSCRCPRPDPHHREPSRIGASSAPAIGRRIDSGPLAAVPWPTARGVLLAEVVTGGASASDEFVEMTNAVHGHGRPRRARARLRHLDRARRSRARRPGRRARPLDPGQHLLVANVRRDVRRPRRRDLQRRLRGDRWRPRDPADRRARHRRGRLGRRDERVRRGCGGAGATGRLEHRAPARRVGRQRRRHERQRRRLAAVGSPPAAEPVRRRRSPAPVPTPSSSPSPSPTPDPSPTPTPHAAPTADTDATPEHRALGVRAPTPTRSPPPSSRPQRRPRRPTPPPTPTPTPTPTECHTEPRPPTLAEPASIGRSPACRTGAS